jgi:hypothetical protein
MPSLPVTIKTMSEEKKYLVSLEDIECVVVKKTNRMCNTEHWGFEGINNSGLSKKVQEMLVNVVKNNAETI